MGPLEIGKRHARLDHARIKRERPAKRQRRLGTVAGFLPGQAEIIVQGGTLWSGSQSSIKGSRGCIEVALVERGDTVSGGIGPHIWREGEENSRKQGGRAFSGVLHERLSIA